VPPPRAEPDAIADKLELAAQFLLFSVRAACAMWAMHSRGEPNAIRGVAGAMKDLEDRQKSRATRVKRDTLDGALLDLAAFYRDVLMVQYAAGAEIELANADRLEDLRRLAAASPPEATLRRIQAIMRCRELLTLNVAPLLAVEEMTISLFQG